MKELSIEEKAKAYDEALKVLHKYDGANIMFSQSLKEEMFPELKESEDDRIRKAIKYGLDHVFTNNTTVFGVTKEQCIAWLEKQIEKDEEILILKDQIESLHAAIVAVKETHRIELEKQGDKKDICATCDHPMLNCQNFPCDEKRDEQKPNTDFSDLRTWKYIVDAVRTEKEGIGQYLDSPFTEEVAKKLQKRFGNIEQKIAKWSEEDEDILNTIINYFKVDIECTDEDDIVRWLKSLKDRYTWKPSDVQIDALVSAIDIMIDNRGAGDKKTNLLSGLYHELKAL